MIQKIRKDHLLHAMGGNYTVLATMIFTTDIVVVIAILAFISIGKEIVYDKWLGKGTPELSDIFATVIGGLIALFLTSII